MLQGILKEDRLVGFLLKNSSFTEAQLDTYIINKTKKAEKKSLNSKIKLRDRKVSKGAFIRTLKQAQRNLKRSIYTVILAEYLEITKEESTAKITQIGSMLRQIKGKELKDEDYNSMIQQISHIITFILSQG